MKAFRLEIIAPPAEAARMRAKDTETKAKEAEAERAAVREEGYRAGYVAGQAAATEAHLDEQSRLEAALVEALQDGILTNEAARAAVLGGVAPLIARFFTALAPSLADAALPEEIARRVDAALRAVPGAKPRIRCAPEMAPVVRAALAARGVAADVDAAPEFLPREAEIAWAQGFDRLDLEGCIAEIRRAIATHFDLEEEDDAKRLTG